MRSALDPPQNRIDLLLDPLAAFLRLRRSDEEKEGQRANLPEELKELRLPVLQGVPGHLDHVLRDLDFLVVRELLVDIGEPAEEPMAGKREEKQREGKPEEIVAVEPVSWNLGAALLKTGLRIRFRCHF
jgi:hypothetical protein